MREQESQLLPAEALTHLESVSSETLLDLTGLLFITLDRTGLVTQANNTACEALGGDSAEVIGKSWLESFVEESDRERVRSDIDRIISGEHPPIEPFESSIRRLDGQTRVILSRYTSVCDESGEVIGVVSSGEDITDRVNAERSVLLFERLVSRVSARILDASTDDLADIVRDALRQVGEHLGAQCVTLARMSRAGRFDPYSSWVSEAFGTPEQLEAILEGEPSPSLSEELMRSGRFIINVPEDFPGWAAEKRQFDQLGALATVVVRTGGDDEVHEGAAIFSLRPRPDWPEALPDTFACLSGLLWSVIRQRKVDQDLREALEQITQLKERLERENLDLRREIALTHEHSEIVGRSPAILRVLELVEQVAPTDVSVLLLGETGTGKELLARAIHRHSTRCDKNMVKLNCAALPPDLVETELFGRQKGAYTDAHTSQPGRFEIADGSTLFLDEVADLPLPAQVKLLRVLQEGEFERVGSTRTIRVDVRIIAATNLDLEQLVREGRFREDLYYRLNVFPIHVPGLRDRTEDIPQLVLSFAQQTAERMGKRVDQISRRSMEALHRYPWPGNIRELRNVVERAVVVGDGSTLVVDLPESAERSLSPMPTLAEAERDYVVEVLNRTGWRVRGSGGAAEILNLKPTTLESRMTRLGIERRKSPGRDS